MLKATIIGLLAGVVGTGMGGLLIALVGRPRNQVYSVALGFSGGIMLAVVFLELLPEALTATEGIAPATGGLVAGAVLISFLDRFLPHRELGAHDPGAGRFMRVGLLIGLGIATHNFPEGLAIGAGMRASPAVGLTVALMMILHNVPEGMAMGSPMLLSGVRPGRMVGLVALAGIPMGLGAALGFAFGNLSPSFLALSLGVASGAMLFIVLHDLVPVAQELASAHHAAFGGLAGVVVGLLAHVILSAV
jgi:ZIP family zinc transporter